MSVYIGKAFPRQNWCQLRNLVSKRKCSSASGNPEKTSLYDFHVKHGGKMVPFAGYLLPVQYASDGIVASHLHTRKHASLFDVSHMLQTNVTGPDCARYFETLCTADVQGLANGAGTLTVFTNDKGGILDDLIVTKVDEGRLYVVSNAAMKTQDMDIMLKGVKSFSGGNQISVEFMQPTSRSLLALQGPESAAALQPLTDLPLKDLYFMTSATATVAGVQDCRITRCGYTGEDGVEISIPADKASDVAEALLKSTTGHVKLAGLGARDSLRLEAGLCLYGNDIDSTITPIEAALAWLVAKPRRSRADFPGASVILGQLSDGCARRRVGLRPVAAGPPARHGTPVYTRDGAKELGVVTSGCPSPSLGGHVAMGYVPKDLSKVGTPISLKVRDKVIAAEVAKMPFVPGKYYSPPKQK